MTSQLTTRFLSRLPGRAGLGGVRATGWYVMRREPTASGATRYIPVAGVFADFESANAKMQQLLPEPDEDRDDE